MATPSLIRLALDERRAFAPARTTHLRHDARRGLERLLIVIGILCVTYFLYGYVEARLYQSFEDRELDKILNSARATDAAHYASTSASLPRRTLAVGTTVGRIEIPRLGVSAVIRAGSDVRTLRLAVGYIPGTALPGDPSNVGLAGHRDTFFRKLRDINPDDEIRIATPDGVFHYYVQRTNIVMPQDVWVLEPTNYPALTLVTCYPFNYIGSAPKRFIVRAVLGRGDAPVRSIVSQRADTTATLQRKPTSVRRVAKRRATVRSAASTPAHTVAPRHAKRSTARTGLQRAKAAARPAVSKRVRTIAKLQTMK